MAACPPREVTTAAAVPAPFALDPRLARDGVLLGRFATSEVLLMDRAELPWLVVVPHTHERELHRLPPRALVTLMGQVRCLATLIEREFGVDKLNIAAIGNVVPQLHVHVVGRYRDDPWWPGVVWGTQSTAGPADAAAVARMGRLIAAACRAFTPLAD
jgi:diadenosine tetraphosphate (Ap4A) HIT family hydrolase